MDDANWSKALGIPVEEPEVSKLSDESDELKWAETFGFCR